MKSKLLYVLAMTTMLVFGCSKAKKEAKAPEVIEEKVETPKEKKGVYFKSPEDGATVSSPVFIQMGASGIEVKAAGEVIEGTGHHHILINQTSWPEGDIIPQSDTTLHFGKGQTDASIELEPGTYTLSLQFANGVHQSMGEDWASSISITVK